MIINVIIFILFISVIAMFFLNTRFKGILTVCTVILIALVTSYISVNSLLFKSTTILLNGPWMIGNVSVKIDSLSAWFILVINFTFVTGALYGFDYMKIYRNRKNEISMHCIAYLMAHSALLGICSVQNGFVFLVLWEIMALSVFILVIFDHDNPNVIKAGINYLIQSHLCIVFLMLGFIYYSIKTGSFNFESITTYSNSQSSLAGTALFFCFFIGFAIKAGFVPFHTWLPYAHPAAPSHVSGIMSGVVIKIGIYGVLRMLLLIKIDYTTVGYFILTISLITGIYGVMLAIIQHNLKKLLAYHSIENIGIIGIGIGIGCIGLGSTNKWMAILGFTGALLHTLNHSLFKSLLFFGAGNVLQLAKTVNVEKLGGLIRKIPNTAILFLVAALAICGLPPLNGFISEFLIYTGLYNWMYSAGLFPQIAIVFALIGLVLIGGLALLCFTKAFSIVFLGNQKTESLNEMKETSKIRLIPMYMIGLFIVLIGLFPAVFINVLQKPVYLFTNDIVFNLDFIRVGAIDSLQTINWMFLGFILMIASIIGIKKTITAKKIKNNLPTWGCGYVYSGNKMQYTANSFVRNYAKIAKPILEIEKEEVDITEVFPTEKNYKTESYDIIEKIIIDKPLRLIERMNNSFLFLHNGHLQRYILYGIIFITAIICVPLIFGKIIDVIQLLKTL
ncbi:MAG TPA: proton-conducting transporter membrane subunit [Bacteroidales bacterium]|nr:proton-conducting transporter membrane subunit [Bacteroidales bacterium]